MNVSTGDVQGEFAFIDLAGTDASAAALDTAALATDLMAVRDLMTSYMTTGVARAKQTSSMVCPNLRPQLSPGSVWAKDFARSLLIFISSSNIDYNYKRLLVGVRIRVK